MLLLPRDKSVVPLPRRSVVEAGEGEVSADAKGIVVRDRQVVLHIRRGCLARRTDSPRGLGDRNGGRLRGRRSETVARRVRHGAGRLIHVPDASIVRPNGGRVVVDVRRAAEVRRQFRCRRKRWHLDPDERLARRIEGVDLERKRGVVLVREEEVRTVCALE